MTETFPWGGSETTYFDASSNVLGKKWSDSHTYTDENGTAQTSSHVSYSKANGDHIGNSWSDSYGSGSSFIVEKTTSTTTTDAPETVNIAVTSSSPFAFDTGSGAVTICLEFVDGNTYVFDVSDASMALKH